LGVGKLGAQLLEAIAIVETKKIEKRSSQDLANGMIAVCVSGESSLEDLKDGIVLK